MIAQKSVVLVDETSTKAPFQEFRHSPSINIISMVPRALIDLHEDPADLGPVSHAHPNRFVGERPDAPGSISPAFLRTCRQIHDEMKDLKPLWTNNALGVSYSLDSEHLCELPSTVTLRVEEVHFEYTFTPMRENFRDRKKCLSIFKRGIISNP